MSYKRFFGMILTSTVIMYGLMYATAYKLSHLWFSQTRLWMAVFMGAMMAVVMLAWVLNMYENKRANVAIFAGSAVLFALGLYLARSQDTVGDLAWMKAMIPHHSIAILTSERANISDPRVRRLADEIILAQRREIAEMEALIADLEGSDVDGEAVPPSVPPVEGGSTERTGPVPGAPSLDVGAGTLIGGVLVIDTVKVASDAWVVVHPAAVSGGPDVARIAGRAFVMHGTTARVPVALDAPVAPGTTLYVMLHEDTGETGLFEFGGAGTPDPPLKEGGSPVAEALVIR